MSYAKLHIYKTYVSLIIVFVYLIVIYRMRNYIKLEYLNVTKKLKKGIILNLKGAWC